MVIGIIGYGKMGKKIEEISVDWGHTVGMKINSKNPKDLNKSSISEIDVAINFHNRNMHLKISLFVLKIMFQ